MDDSEQSYPKKMQTCLLIDLFESTAFGRTLTPYMLSRFNQALAEQISRYVGNYLLDRDLYKFEGDGWLVFSSQEDAGMALSCFAKDFVVNFKEEIHKLTSLPPDVIPDLRISICTGMDSPITLPNGTVDYSGDSARKAARSSQLCQRNEILVDYTVYNQVYRCLDLPPIDIELRLREAKGALKWEEDIPLYSLGEIREGVDASKESIYLVRLFDALGRTNESLEFRTEIEDVLQEESATTPEDTELLVRQWNKLLILTDDSSHLVRLYHLMKASGLHRNPYTFTILINKASDYTEALAWFDRMRAENVSPTVVTFNTLINLPDTYATAKHWYDEMVDAGIAPDIVTFNTLINLSDTYATAKHWYDEMVDAGIAPDIWTYNTLINRSDTYATAKHWYDEMVDAGIAPDIVAFSTLINLSDTYATAKQWYDEMCDAGIAPNIVTFSALINLSDTYDTAKHWHDEMCKAGIVPDIVTFTTLIRRSKDIDTAEDWYNRMLAEGIAPDVYVFSTLMHRTSSYDGANQWFEQMSNADVQPNLIIFSTMINRSQDYKTASMWYERMVLAGITPDLITYSTMIKRSPDTTAAWSWFKLAIEDGFTPDERMYASLFQRHIIPKRAKFALNELHHLDIDQARAAQFLLRGYIRFNMPNEAFRVVLSFPDLADSRKLMRDERDLTLKFFDELHKTTPDLACCYAYGIALFENELYREATQLFSEAAELGPDPDTEAKLAELLNDTLDKLSNQT